MNFNDYFDDKRGQTGIGTQLNIYDETLGKYVLLIPLETVPSVVGSTDTVEVDLLTSSLKTKLKGKSSVDDKDVEFLWHRDNLLRLRGVANKQSKFLVSYPDYTGWGFTGSINYKPNDATSDKLTGTFTIIASSVDEFETQDVRDLMAKTCVIDSPTDATTEIKMGETFKHKMSSSISEATFKAESNSTSVATVTFAESTKELTITPVAKGYCIISITASAPNCASWTTTIAVEVL